jgi:hypothetical protein
VRRGRTEALRLLGYGNNASVSIDDVRFAPRRVAIGGRVSISFVVRSKSKTAQSLLVDVEVHFVKANGRAAAKVFKLKRIELSAHNRVPLQTVVSLAVHTTRRPRPGKHVVDVIVNGKATRVGAFTVMPPRR